MWILLASINTPSALRAMEKLHILRASPNYNELIVLYHKEKRSKLKERFHALILMHELKNCSKIAVLLKRSRKSIQLWVNVFNEGGLGALVPNSPPGRPSRLTENQMKELEKDILTHPRMLGYNFSNWEGRSVSHHIKTKFGVDLKVRQCQTILHKMNLSLQRPRYDFPNADPREQEEFAQQFKKS